MFSNNLKCLIFGMILSVILVGCDQDTDTPPELKREKYMTAKLYAAPAERVDCEQAIVVLPETKGDETLGYYILQVHAANRGGSLTKMDLADMQTLYRTCLRPAILNRVRPSRD